MTQQLQPRITSFKQNRKNGLIGRLNLLEWTFSLNKPYTNPYDPDEIDIHAVILLPESDTVVRVPAFWYEGYQRRLAKGQEILEADDLQAWKVRFTPRQLGVYHYYLEVYDSAWGKKIQYPEEGFLSFSCVFTADKGFLRVSQADPAYLEYESGEPYLGIGHNLCGWEWGGTDNRAGTYEYDEWLTNLANNKATMAQFDFCEGDQIEWTGHPDELPFSDAWEGLNRYNQQTAWKMDYRIQRAEELSIFFRLSLLHWEDFDHESENFPDWGWNRNPYNEANGGPLENAAQFFTSHEAKSIYKKCLRYTIARWGYSKNILAYELWNEVDSEWVIWGNSSSYKENEIHVAEWHQEMAAYLKQIDPNQSILTTSFEHSYNGSLIWPMPEIDMTTFHRYTYYNPVYGDESLETVETLHKLISQRLEATGKPVLAGEFALSPGGDIQKDSDPHGMELHNQLWSSVMAKGMGTAMHWTWGSYMHDYNLYYHYKPLACFFADEDLRGFRSFHNFTDKGASIQYMGLQSAERALVWIKDRKSSMQNVREGYQPAIIAHQIIALDGLLPNVNYEALYFNTRLGTWLDTLELLSDESGSMLLFLPEFQYDMALKLQLKGASISWESQDIGAAKLSSATSAFGKKLVIHGGGSGIGGARDECRFVYYALMGDSCEITARIDSLTNLGELVKSGLMIRESSAADARFAWVGINPTEGVQFGYRLSGEAVFSQPAHKLAFQGYLRLARTGDQIKASISEDSLSWVEQGAVLLSGMAAEVLVGMAVCSKDPYTYVTSEFYDIQIREIKEKAL